MRKISRGSLDGSEIAIEELAAAALRAITRPEVRSAGARAAVEVLSGLLGASQAVLSEGEPPAVAVLREGEWASVDEAPPAAPEHCEVPLRSGDVVIGRLRLDGLAPSAENLAVLSYVAPDLAWETARDVEKAELTVPDHAALWQQAINALADPVAVFTIENRVVSWNPAMERLTGRRQSDALLRPVTEVLAVRDDEGQLIDGGPVGLATAGLGDIVPDVEEAELVRQDGTSVRCSFQFAPLSPGTPDGVVVTIRAVPEERRWRGWRDDVYAAAALELQVPLAPLAAAIEGLGHGALDPAARVQMREAATSQVARLAQVADTVLVMAQVEELVRDNAFVEVDPRTVAVEVIRRLSPGEARRVEVRVPSLVAAWSVPALVERIVAALVDNALEHTRGPVHVVAVAVEDRIRIDVDDAGRGLPKAVVDRVAWPFRRIPAAAAVDGVGSGLGLPLSAVLAARLGGRLILAESPTGGTRAQLFLPQRPAQKA